MNLHRWRINSLERDHTEGAIQVNTVVDDNLVEPITRALANGLAGKRYTILRLPVDLICVAAPLEAPALASGG
jgi:nitrogen regulatory protein PII-like uncharacterized protein